MEKQSILRNLKFFKTATFVLVILCLSVNKGFSQCAYPSGATAVGTAYTFCIDTNTVTTPTLNSGNFVLVNVVQGFRYTFSVGNVFSNSERLNIYRVSDNINLGYNIGSSGATISSWVAPSSGQVKVLLLSGDTCSGTGTVGGSLTITLNSIGNTFDNRATSRTNTWVGHVYNWTGTVPPGGASPATVTESGAFAAANYVGYYNIAAESIAENFTGDNVCFSVLSNLANWTNIRTETFAVRYRMLSTRPAGYYMLSVAGDDGVRVYVDNNLVVDAWRDQGTTTYCSNLVYLSGNSTIVLDYYENGGGNVVNFSLTQFTTSTNSIAGSAVRNVCSGISPGLLDASGYAACNATPLNGGLTFQWQSSTDNLTFSNISGANAEDYTPPTYSTNNTTYYRRLVKSKGLNSGLGGSPSNVITVNTTLLTAGPASAAPTLCVSTPLANITHTTTGASGIGTATGLPPNVTATWVSNMITISGTPTAAGTYNYNIPLAGCGGVNATGEITVLPLATVPAASSALNLSIAGSTVTGSISTASPAPLGYLIIRTLTPNIFTPNNGTSYNTGATTENYLVVRGTASPSSVTTFTDVVPTNGTYYYSVFSFNNGCGTSPLYSAGTSASIKYICSPSSTSSGRYIKNVQFVGTLSRDTTNPSGYSSGGYIDYSSKAEKAVQTPGDAININFSAVAPTNLYSNAKAWVDWNKDAVFETGEMVYNSKGTGVNDLIFGYVVPLSTAPGFYTIRLRTFNTQNFDACGTLSDGETEDYTFQVIEDCATKITDVEVSKQCGAGPVTLTATATPGTVSYLWYKQEFGVPISGATSNVYTTENLSVGTHTYYVRAVGASCASVYYRPVKITVSPTPTVQFSQTSPDICGYESFMKVSSSGDKQEVNLFSDNFATFNNFINVIENTSAGATESNWQLRPSPYVYSNILTPAVSSGYDGGNYAAIVTDQMRSTNLLNHLTLSSNLNSTGYLNLNLDFDLYYFSEVDNDITRGYLKVQSSIDGGVTWSDIPTLGGSPSLLTKDYGIPTKWEKISIALPPDLINQTQLRFRISMFAYGGGAEYMANLAAVDNIRIYGDKPLNTAFSWASDTVDVYAANCTDPYANTPTYEVCIKPTTQQIENNVQFRLSARANLSNGCYAEGELIIPNSSKFWNNSSNEWATTNWKPGTDIPTADNCVIIKKPVTINATTQGLAKNITVEPSGELQISGSLKVTDFVKNYAPSGAVVIESDASLVQVNEGSNINVGSITAKRKINVSTGRQQYNYIISPLEGQYLKTIYPNIEYVLYHNETNNFFYNSSGAYIKGRALAVKEPKAGVLPAAKASTATATFTGYPTNGAFTYNLVNSNTASPKRGYNLVGNPYPSNMDLIQFYHINSGSGNISNAFHLWDNRANSQTVQMGDKYEGQAYAIFHATTPPGEGTGTLATGDVGLAGVVRPTRYIKVGQGFMVKTSVNNQPLLFNNTVRTHEDGPSFFGRTAENTVNFDRFWLNMITPTNLRSDMAVVYFEGGTNGFSSDDAASLGGSDELYSRVDDSKVNINGRSIFTDEDVVPLGTRHFTTGEYRIELACTDGIFSSAQPVYLKDKLTGAITNLSESAYSFAAEAGESTGRFEIVYKTGGTLATDAGVEESVVVYREKNHFHVRSGKRNITGLQLFDSSGRLVYSTKPNAAEFVIDANPLPKGVYFLRIERGFDVVSKKIIR